MRRIFAAASLCLLAMAGDALAQTATPTEVGTFRDWRTYTVADPRGKQCFILSEPMASLPKDAKRDPIYFMVMARPSDGIKNEASVIIGYPFKDGSKVSVEIGAQKFPMFTKEDQAWMDEPGQEDGLIAAMKKGATMVVKGVSRRGTSTTDTFGLGGITAALDKMAEACK